MLIAWMIYAVALTTIVAGCALALDRIAEIWSAARRTIWLVALVIAVAVPVALALRPAREVPVASATFSSTREPEQMSVEALTGRTALSEVKIPRKLSLNRLSRHYALPAFWNRIAAVAWIAASIVLAGLLLRGAFALWRSQTRWSRSIVDGHPVLLTGDVGPAVIGVLRPRILLPSWALALGDCERRMMLEHEAEHVQARDPILIAVAAWTLALFPWNPAVWFIVKRLRLAIEIDCDRRVLARRTSNVRDYGMLLLAVGSRAGSAPQFGVSLAEPRRFLEQRILAMTTARPSRPLVASAPFVAIAFLAAIAVAQTPRPTSTLVTPPATPSRVAANVDTTPMREPPRLAPVAPPVSQREPLRLPRRMEGVPRSVATPLPAEMRSTTPALEPLSINVIRQWIQSRHPNIIAGDAHVNAVIIVVDANNQYLASATDSIADAGRVGDWVNFRVLDPATRVPQTSASQPVIYVDGVVYDNPDRLKAKPVVIVDGVRLENVEQLDSMLIKSVEVLKGSAAAATFGPDAANGVIVVTSTPRTTVDLSRFGIAAESLDEMTEFRLKPGVVGPNRLYITVLQIKKR